jgi:beta-glucosidase
MCAMSRVNGSYGCENSPLINQLLKTELAFPGMVTPDTSAQHTALGSANGGLDLGDSSLWNNDTLLAAMANGSFSQARLDDIAVRNLMGFYHENIDEKPRISAAGVTEYRDVRRNHRELIRRAGGASISLLKNSGGLPLSKPKSMAVFGANARPVLVGPAHVFDDIDPVPAWDGHLVFSGGSGTSSPSYVITPYDALLAKALIDGTQMMWILNATLIDPNYVAVAGTSGTMAAPKFEGYAAMVDTCIVFINAWSGEGNDRTELRNADQDGMILSVADNCNNTIVSVTTVGARILDTWIEHPNITGVIYSSLLGEQSGQALVDVLYGDANPSGRLTHTVAKDEGDYPVEVCLTADCNFDEGVYLDYKYFDSYNVTPCYEFSFRLSYTNFTYSPCSTCFSYNCATVPAITFTNQTALSMRYAQGALAPGGQLDMWDIVMTLCV